MFDRLSCTPVRRWDPVCPHLRARPHNGRVLRIAAMPRRGWPLLLMASLANPAEATEPLSSFQPAPDASGLISTTSADTLEPRQLSAGLATFGTFLPSEVSLTGGTARAFERATTELELSVSPLDRFQVTAVLPYLIDPAVGVGGTVHDLGDIRVGLKGTPLRTGDRYPRYGGRFAFALHSMVRLPTGDPARLPGTGISAADLGVAVQGGAGRTRLLANLSYQLYIEPGQNQRISETDALQARGGLGITLQPYAWELLLEAVATAPLAHESLSAVVPILVSGGIRRQSPSGLSFTLAAGAARPGASTLEGWVGLMVRQQFPPNHIDRDEDGIQDAVDRCPTAPEDRDQFDDQDGCPENDNDLDGVPDEADLCKGQPEDHDRFEDDDGCPDSDNDRDDIPDTKDHCPTEAEDRDGFDDEDGCPDTDNDHDGVPDDLDTCPWEPEDLDNFEDPDGCPDPDNDRDGFPDLEDQCPTGIEDVDGFQDQDGCPDPDNDLDGLGDFEDLCPENAEDQTDPQQQDGCPAGTTLVFRGDRWLLLEEIQFTPTDDEVLPRSHGVLEQLAQALREAPPRSTFLVECFTDNRGDDQINLRRSADRARAVAVFLIARGIEPERVASIGYGETRPIDTNATDAGRANNRRLQVIVATP